MVLNAASWHRWALFARPQLGDALILMSTLLEDDGQVLDAYDEGVSFLRKAYERNPSMAQSAV